MQSLEGSERARPDTALFDKINDEIAVSESKVIPINRLRLVAAAAAVLLLVNVSVVSGYLQEDIAGNQELVADDNPYSILSDYKVYNQ